MRLLELKGNGKFSLTNDIINNTLPYAILSHTWGGDDDEVNFKDAMEGSGKTKAGYRKIQFCLEQTARDGLQYCWVDTCCIDKSNNTELSEAINSMFRWYRNAARCYVYLSDVSTNEHDHADPSLQSWNAFQESRWFTRGWTLQELIAPRSVEFFCSNGRQLGDKKSLERQLHEITGIAVSALDGTPLSEFSIEERMSWAENRVTKRDEDKAYSLLGIFDVHMPLIYGEGPENAFSRLEEEIYKRPRKHQLDELSAIFNSRKRLRAPHNPSSEYPVSSDNPPETRKELVVTDSIDAATKQSLIAQLYFAKIDERLTSLTAAQGTTCRWILTKPEYTSWHNPKQHARHGGFLWIKGNPGTGKSTLMKLLFEEAKLKARGDLSKVTLSFFFLARGTVEEKSTTGLYRSLLHQLFEKVVEVSDSLEWMTVDGARVIQRNGWGEEALKQTLTLAVQKLGNRSLTIFVDALDECDKNQAGGMICFFEELCDLAAKARVRLQICFSSRHYPTVIIQKGIEITLEDEAGHTEDIKQYIKSKFRLGKMKQAELLRTEILEQSSSIFLWVVLVLDILNNEYPDSSISITKIRERLKKIPPKLTDLFRMILIRDKENLERLELCLKWILFANRPLQPQELYFAIQLGLDKESLTSWDKEDVELDQIKTFVRSASKGLAEVTRNKASEVQFIHESVRDYLLGKYESPLPEVSGNFVGRGNEVLRDCCLAQLKASINQDTYLWNHLPPASATAELRETIALKFPFLQYSVHNVLRHANVAQQNEMEQGDFLADFPLRRWVFLYNTLEKFDVRRYTESVSLIYILAVNNLANLIRIHPQREFCFEVEPERYGVPILAALATGGQEAVQSFLDALAESHPQEPLLHYLSKLYSNNISKRPKFSRNLTFSKKKSVFSNIAELGDEVVLAFLCTLGKLDLESKDGRGRTALSWAAMNGHEAVVKLLLDKGADVESKDGSGHTPLSWAAMNGREGIVKVLLDTGKVDVNWKDKDGWTPLLSAASRMALSLSAEKGYKAILKMLLNMDKVDIDSKDKNDRTPLSWAAEKGHEAVVKMLLDTGKVDIDSEDKDYQTPLSWAKAKSSKKHSIQDYQMQLLLLEQQNKKRLLMARQEQERGGSIHHEAVIKLLLATDGIEANTKDPNGRTPLSWAAGKGQDAIFKALLNIGNVDVESKDNDGRTPLLWAVAGMWPSREVENENRPVVELLLKAGAKESQLFSPVTMVSSI